MLEEFEGLSGGWRCLKVLVFAECPLQGGHYRSAYIYICIPVYVSGSIYIYTYIWHPPPPPRSSTTNPGMENVCAISNFISKGINMKDNPVKS